MDLRPARPADYPAFAALFPELASGDETPGRRAWEEGIAADTLLAEGPDGILGYAYGQVMQEVGYVRHLVVAPRGRGAGLGRSLMLALATRFRKEGLREWCLNVKPDNEPALALYRDLGFTPRYDSTVLRFDWSLLERLPLGPPGVRAALVEPARDAAVEEALGLPAGTLATQRGRPGRVLAGLLEEETWVAFAAFDPDFPGAFPFRVARADLGPALLRVLRPHAVQEAMGVVVEDDPSLADLLARAGARVHMRITHMRGPLPTP